MRVVGSILTFALCFAACIERSVPPTAPTPVIPLSVTGINPKTEFGGSTIHLSGTGFRAGVTVTLGEAATHVAFPEPGGTLIRVWLPKGVEGTVDVVVANVDGQSARLVDGFTYEFVRLTPSSTLVTAGSQLSVQWTASSLRPSLDWIALSRLEGPTQDWGIWKYTAGGSAGTLTFNAPSEPGQYEFRYLPDDGYADVARSVPITVVAKSP